MVTSGGLSFDRASLYSRPTGAFCHQNLIVLSPNAHRLLHPYPLGAAVVGRTSYHSFARVGGVLPTYHVLYFAYIGPKARGKRYHRTTFCPPGGYNQSLWRASPVKGGLGGDAYEHWRKPSAHRRRPPVTLWCLSGDPERHPPRRAEPFFKSFSSLCRRGTLA